MRLDNYLVPGSCARVVQGWHGREAILEFLYERQYRKSADACGCLTVIRQRSI